MISRLRRSAKPIVIISQDDLRAISGLVDEAEDDEKPHYKLEITIEMRNGDKIITNCVEDVFEIPDKRSNRIKSISLSRGGYTSKYVNIDIGGDWSDFYGAKLTVHGEPSFTLSTSEKFDKIFKKERPISEFLASANPILLTIAIELIFISFIADKVDFDGIRKKGIGNGEIIFGFTSIFSALSFFIFPTVNYAQYHLFGRAAFIWNDGKTRYEKNIKILNYLSWTVPAAFVIKYAQFLIGL